MAAFVLLLLILAMTGHSDATWCACRPEADSTALQKAIDYACGNGADCTAIQTNGPCFQPNTMRAHCNYAVNSYFQRKGQGKEACIFSNTAATTQIDPGSSGACIYPSTGSSTPGGSTTPGGTSTTPGGNTGISPPGGISSPSAFNSPPGGFNTGGAGFGLGPSSINTDSSAGVSLLSKTELLVTLLVLTLLVFIQG